MPSLCPSQLLEYGLGMKILHASEVYSSCDDPIVGKFDNYSPISSYDVSLQFTSTKPAGDVSSPHLIKWYHISFQKQGTQN